MLQKCKFPRAVLQRFDDPSSATTQERSLSPTGSWGRRARRVSPSAEKLEQKSQKLQIKSLGAGERGPRIWAQLGLAMPWSPHESPLYGPRGSGPGSILRPKRGEGQNQGPQARSVHRNNGGLWLAAGMWPLSCPGPQPQGLRSPGRAGWRGSVRQALVCQGQDTQPAASPLWAGGRVGHQARAHLRTPAHKGSHAQGEEKQDWTQGSQASLGPTAIQGR